VTEIGAPGRNATPLRFPVDVAVREAGPSTRREVFVVDQGNARIQVFDATTGASLRTIGGPVDPKATEWQGRFARPQALSFDAQGRLHVLDVQMARVQVLDADSGAFLETYGSRDSGPERLRLPLDLLVDELDSPLIVDGQRVVAILPKVPAPTEP
jgi:DNA-binding beta-propeller fold protein YncE